MANKPAKAEKAQTAKGGSGVAWLIIWPMVLMMSAAFPPLLIMVAGMLPTLIARMVDPHPEKALTVCAGACNAVGCAYWLIELILRHQTTWQHLQSALLAPFTWLVLLGATGVGWGIWIIVPQIVAGQIATHYQQARIRAVKAQQKLVSEWGQGITAP